jgi:single-stranded DNA-binding protein
MQIVVFTGRLAADPSFSPDGARCSFRLIETSGTDAEGRKLTNAVNCVSFNRGFNNKVLARGLAKGCEATATGRFQDNAYTAASGVRRTSKELLVDDVAILDWAEDRGATRADDKEAV